jgi:hypothetical protein
MRMERYGSTRYWAVRERDGSLICLCVYKRGAFEVLRRLQAREKERAYVGTPGTARIPGCFCTQDNP